MAFPTKARAEVAKSISRQTMWTTSLRGGVPGKRGVLSRSLCPVPDDDGSDSPVPDDADSDSPVPDDADSDSAVGYYSDRVGLRP